MGGLAFASGPEPLYTPRMPPKVYKYVRDQCHELLRQIFVCVATPIEGPAKEDFGDIDIFVTWECKKAFPLDEQDELAEGLPEDPLQAAAYLLKAECTKKEQPHALMLAIPWPRELPEETNTDSPTSSKASEGHIRVNEDAIPRFIQVDLHYFQDLGKLQWMLFKHAHGDLWNILGSTIRPYGLTIDEVGLYLRIPEIENENRKKAKILLTQDPTETLQFLGLPTSGQEWKKPFATFNDLFEYAASCRFFWVRRLDSPSGDENDANAQAGGDDFKDNLKSNDRRRMLQRPVFRAWVDEFLPACQKEGRLGDAQPSRVEVREEAFNYFGVQGVYEARLLEWRTQRQKETLWNRVIKAALPDGLETMWRSCAASAMKKIIMQGDTSFNVCPPRDLKEEDGLYNEDRVRDFVQSNWKLVGDAAWRKNQENFRQHRAKQAKRTVSGTKKPDGNEASASLSEGPDE